MFSFSFPLFCTFQVSSQCYLLQQLARRTKHVVQIVLFLQFVSVISVIASRVMQGA
jgi:hypothetical protein